MFLLKKKRQAACVSFNMHTELLKIFQAIKQVYVWDCVNSLIG